jgi:AcrR family transcriptional regulator
MPGYPEVTAATRQAFIDAFCDLCQAHPGERVTVQQVARRAGYSRCTFYEYFAGVPGLLEELEDEIIAYACDQVAQTADYLDIVDRFVGILAGGEDAARYAGVLLGNAAYSAFPQRLKAAVLPVLLQRFRTARDAAEAVYVLDFYLSGLIALMTRWFGSGRDMAAEELGGLVRALLSQGVLHALS